MPTNDGKLPPLIMEQLKKKGWTWPPTEERRRQFREARAQFVGSMHMDPEVWREVVKSFPGRFPDEDEAD